jgi:hypothetical protein
MSYYEEARRRAQRLRSPWNLLLIPAVVLPAGSLWWGAVKGLEALHAVFYPAQNLRTASNSIGAIFATVSPFFATIPVAMIVGNYLVWLIPPARRVLAREAEPHPGTGFREAQRQLIQCAKYMVPLGLSVGIIGAVMSWGR